VKEGTAAMPETAAPAEKSAQPDSVTGDYDASADYVEEGGDQEKGRIADPLEPFNRAVYHFNDKLYFWVLKPVAQGYKAIVPEFARIGVNNFFTNIAFPIRFVNCLLQANFNGAGRELGRFMLNTTAGIGGLFDPASHPDVNIAKQDEDFGQTLGVYGLGQGVYINWPILGPSSPRDTLGLVGDYFLHPFFYYDGPWLISWELRGYEKVNDTSLRIGDYEALKGAAIDPYVAIRDAYVQYRWKKVKMRRAAPIEELAPSGARLER
jgi:phospholipid-binding lipoprotein MlaA